MFAVIRDFLLEPALMTAALLALPALLLLLLTSRWRGTHGHETPTLLRQILALLTGESLSVIAILLFFSASVVSGNDLLQHLTWPLLAIVWTAVSAGIVGIGKMSLVLGPLIAALAFALDSWFTVAILFE